MRIILIGACGHGKVCAEIASLMLDQDGRKKYDEILFLDDNTQLKSCSEYMVVGVEDDYEQFLDKNTEYFVSIGNGKIRNRIVDRIVESGGGIAKLIHPSAVISRGVPIGAGSVVMAGVVINPGANIGSGAIVNTCSSIDHDCIIGDYVHVSVGAHLCGSVKVGRQSWIGAGATVSNNVSICGDSMIGAGAVVVDDIKTSGTYVGVPARKVLRN